MVNLLLCITLLLMVLACPTTQYPINIESIIRIWATQYLIPPAYVELMDEHRHMMEGDYFQHLRSFPKKNLILVHYMLSACWLHLQDGLVHYVIYPGAIE